MLTIPGTNFQLIDSVKALWYLSQWNDRISAWEADKREGKVTPMPKPEDLDPPPLPVVKDTGAASHTASPTFALTIGIDTYLRHGAIINSISGCVADADDVAVFLIDTLHIPRNHVINLRNEEANAAGIMAAFDSLATNDCIPYGANIVVYYAGHGSEASPPPGWPSSGNIQMLLPYDFDPGSGPNPVAKNGLSDIKINQLLEIIANKKGNNITVIFDCCYSGSGTRHSGSTEDVVGAVARVVRLPEGTTLGADALPVSRGSTVLEKDRNKGLASHVLLAACTEQQFAYERNGRGAFTRALTNLLRSEKLEQLTNSDVVQRLPQLPGQNPQCEGINKDQIFLNNCFTPSRRTSYHITENAPGEYEIAAGEAHGVTVGAEFTVYDPNRPSDEPCRLVVHNSSAFQASLRRVGGAQGLYALPPDVFALQTRIGKTQDVRLFIELDGDVAGVYVSLAQQMRSMSAFGPSFKVVASREENPDLIITARDGIARFEITDTICRDVGLHEIFYRPATDERTMTTVLRGVADFYWNLHRTPPGAHTISSQIEFECHELATVAIDNNLLPVREPIGENLYINGVIQIEIANDLKPYGFRISNKSGVPLFVSVFYFNMSDLSIDPYYQPPSADRHGHFPSLAPDGFLTIGYGTGGSPPYSYYLHEGQDIDVGYIKLFLSTEYVRYSNVPQKSPFLPQSRGSAAFKPRSHLWDTILVPIIQRRIYPS